MSHTHSRRNRGLSMIAASLVAFALLSAEVQAQVRQLTPPKQGSVGTASTVTAASAIDFFNNANDPSDADIRLQVYDVPSELIGPVGAQIQVHFHNVPDVRVTTEPGSGKLMVMAPQSVHREIGAQIDGFMQQNRISAGDRGVSNLASTRQQSYDLQHLDWRGLEDALRRLAGERLSVTTERGGEVANLQLANATGRPDIIQVDRRQNKVALLGGAPSTAGWTQVVRTLDQGSVDPRSATRILPLAPAEPRSVKRAFRLVKTTIQDQAGNQGGSNQAGGGEARVELEADGQATAMGSFDSLSAASGMFGDVQIEFIEEIDLVIIRGRPQDLERALKVIDEIKRQAKESQPEVEIMMLRHANGEAVAALVTQLYETVYAPRQGSVSITALGQPNALLLIGRAEVVESVKNLVDKIDQPLDPQNQLKVIPLLHASSEDLQVRIREFFVNNPGVDTAVRPGLGTRVKVLSDYRTNSLIVQAAPREMLEVEKLIGELDVESATAQSGLRVFRLKNTMAADLRTVIEEVIAGPTSDEGGATSQATPPSGKLTIVGDNGKSSVESGILAGVVVTSDPSANALLVRAPAQSMELIAKLIEELDRMPSAEAKIKVYPIENGDATQLSQTLQQLYGLQVTAGQSTTGGLFGLGNLNQPALTAGGESSLVQLRITPEIRTNSIIVSGSSADLEVIEALLYRLDIEGVENRKTEVIWLRNATAQAVATAVTTYVTQQRQVNQLLVQTNQFISVFDQVDREVFVVADPDTNSVILSATPRYFETMMKVIERLDRRPPLVEIQVMIAEVRLDDSFELGTEWGIQDGLLFDRQSATGGTLGSPPFNILNPLTGPSRAGLGQTQNVAGQGMSSFGMGRSSATATGVGGLVLSASSEAVGVLVRALQTAGRLQVLSNPQITTMDGRQASTLVGQQVPRVQGVTAGTFGQTINATDVPVGLGLAVLPRVNQDGLILMQVQVQNSSIGDINSGIPVGFGPGGEVIRSPIINSIEALTTVSAYSGQTVVFAGLISKSRTNTRNQIPVLGSLPWIGAAFRFDTETDQRRELLVVLTPRIIQTDEDYEMVKTIASSRMSWCLADVLNVHGDVGLTGGNGLWGPAKSATIYPDMQPTVIEDRATPNSGKASLNQFYDPSMPNMIEGYPLGTESKSLIEPAQLPSFNADAQISTANSTFRSAGYVTPAAAPPLANEVPVQRTPY
ncbi:MAG: general secretion pathway protein GspD [Pirellulaceae bacterium]|nr:general secretion pathway protein GspD [Pirellulaceae bacterium]